MSSAAASMSSMNCRSVASRAPSGTLLTSPTSRQPAWPPGGFGPLSTTTGMPLPREGSEPIRRSHTAMGRLPGVERLVEIGDDVVDMLDADAQPDHLRPPAGLALLLGRHLPMRGGSRMTGERFRVAHVDQALEQPEGVVEPLAGRKATRDPEGQQRAGPAAEIFLRQRVVGTVGKSGIPDPVDPGVVAQEFGDAPRILDVALHPQRDRLDALQQQEGAERREHRAGCALIDAARARDIGGLAEMIDIDQAVIRGVGPVEHREALRVLLPGKFSAVDDDAAP